MKNHSLLIASLLLIAVLTGCTKGTPQTYISGGLVTINGGHADSTNFIITGGTLNTTPTSGGSYSTYIKSSDTFSVSIIGRLYKGINTLGVPTPVTINIYSSNNQGGIDSSFYNNTGTIQLGDSTLTFNLQISSANNPSNTYPFTGTVKY